MHCRPYAAAAHTNPEEFRHDRLPDRHCRGLQEVPSVLGLPAQERARGPQARKAGRALGSHRRLLGRIIAEKQPGAIVATFPAYPWLLNQLRREGHFFCPHYTVVTDALTINSVWYRPASAGWFVTDADSAAFLRARGVPGDRIHVSGFPVALAFADRTPQLVPPEPASPAQPRRVLFMINTGRTRALGHRFFDFDE